MLKVHAVRTPDEKREWLAQFSPRDSTFLVSDLKSKFEIQRLLLERHPCLEEDSVLRASELWRKIGLRVNPEVRVVHLDFVRTLAQAWLETQDIKWARTAGAAQQLLKFTRQFLPILSHASGAEMLDAWLQEHPESIIRWRHWFQLAQNLWQYLQNERLIPAAWLPGILVNEPQLQRQWPRRLIVDLSAQVTGEEVELFLQLARATEIHILAPHPNWLSEYRETDGHYAALRGESVKISERSWADKSSPAHKVQFLRYSTMLAEIKAAVAQVRDWCDSGVPLNRVGILAPDIELFWPTLSAYLEQEGIAVDKPVVSRLQSRPAVQKWLALIRLHLADINASDLEMGTFAMTAASPLSFEKFARLYTHIYENEDLERDTRIAAQFQRQHQGDEVLDRDEFLVWSIQHWPHGEATEEIELIVQAIFQDTPPATRLPCRLWRSYIESVSSRIETTVARATPGGVRVLSLNSAEWLSLDCVFMLGVTEQALRQVDKMGLTFGEVQSIGQQLGFRLPYPDQLQLDFEARWLIEKSYSDLKVSCAATDFSGAPLSPSLMWLLASANPREALEQLDTPPATRWDQIQAASATDIQQLRAWSDGHGQVLESAMLQDLGVADLPKVQVPRELSLSASQLENYADCPFIFAAQKVFRLSDLPDLDLDVDAMTRGKVMHALFEQLTVEPFRSTYSDSELADIIEQVRIKAEVVVADDRMWAAQAEKFRDLAKRFLGFEAEWRRQFPATRTVATEFRVRGRWDLKLGRLVSEDQSEAGPIFNGAIDRIDTDDRGHVVIIDYKSSDVGLTHYSSWSKNDSLQLSLYLQAVEAGLTAPVQGEVVGAVYFVAKSMNRDKGLTMMGAEQLLPQEGRRRSLATDAQKQSLVTSINERVQALALSIRSGEFAPRPRDLGLCPTCNWRWLCRAPHLN